MTKRLETPAFAAAHGVRRGHVDTTPPIGKTLTEIASMVDNGQLKPHVSAVLPLQEIRKAHELIEGRHTDAKIVLEACTDPAALKVPPHE